MKTLTRPYVPPASHRPPAEDRHPGFDVPVGARPRVRRALERAEMLFTARVAEDGGIGRWRRLTEIRFLAARETYVRQKRLSRSDTAALVVALVDLPTRDRCWVQVESGCDPAWTGFWHYLTRRALPPYRAEPLFLLAWTAFRLRDAELAQIAVGAALAEDPGHTAGAMLARLVRNGTDPARLPSLSDRYTARRDDR
jgi:hypothetical protein